MAECEEAYGVLPCSTSLGGTISLMLAYGFLLLKGAGLLSDGSELLLEILNPGIVGGLVLPILGAMPDSLIILFSGMGKGPKEEIQEQVAVGVGALAGSTIMMLTIAWGASLILGRTDLNSRGKMIDKRLTKVNDWVGTGISVDQGTRLNAVIMVATAALYLTIQVPALMGHGDDSRAAFAGAVMCAVCLLAYCIYQVVYPELQKRKIAVAHMRRAKRLDAAAAMQKMMAPFGGLLDTAGAVQSDVVNKIFTEFDQDGDGNICMRELRPLVISLSTLARGNIDEDLAFWMKEFDKDKSGHISRQEFYAELSKWARSIRKGAGLSGPSRADSLDGDLETALVLEAGEGGEGDVAVEEEHAEVKVELTPRQIATKAVLLLAAGAFVCGLFADPMVDAVTGFSAASGIPAFFVAFVVAPLASNASELVSSLIFAAGKRERNMSLTYSQVYGAITMNNTMCLGLFLAVVYVQGLTWTFTSEVAITVGSTILVGIIGMSSRTVRAWMAPMVLCLYPLSILLVYVFDYVLMWDGPK